jgi:1,6-anhydro-N-acetylmuramate kinase
MPSDPPSPSLSLSSAPSSWLAPRADGRRIAVGCMSGTSLDGLDAVWIEAQGRGRELVVRVLGQADCGFGELSTTLALAARQEPLPVGALARLGAALGRLHAELLGSRPDLPAPDLIAVHGQTLYHGRDASFALFDPTALLAAQRCAIVTDLRLVDRAAGGEGAPITPLADWLLLRGDRPRAVINLGGFCNLTRLPGAGGGLEAVSGGDVVPCNQLLDGAARAWLGRDFDPEGQAASAGQEQPSAAALLERAFGAADGGPPRSLGTGDERWELLDSLAWLGPEDALASLCAAIGWRIAAAARGADELLLFGGGARNLALVAAIERAAREAHPTVRVLIGSPTDRRLGPQAREGAAMAVLGLAAADGLAITLPAVTGRGATWHLDGRWCLPRSPGRP